MTFKNVFFPLILALLLTSSCTEDLEIPQYQELTPEEKASSYLNAQSNEILFAAINVNHITHLVEGILVDKNSSLRALKIDLGEQVNFTSTSISASSLDLMYSYSESIADLDPIRVSEMHRASKNLRENLEYNESDESDESNFLISYKRSSNSASSMDSDGCGNDSSSLTNTEHSLSFSQSHIKVYGKINHEVESANHLLLTNYLEELWLDAAFAFSD